jgi:3-hydroxy-9,10-secoandrosta-1,3,5(10)-triene-9,17-dione monooxygenase reductase component
MAAVTDAPSSSDGPAEPIPFDSREFRDVLGHFATGVTVVTGTADGVPLGLAANAFSSVSLDPPLILVCMSASSETWPAIRKTGAFAVNVLGEHQEDLSRRFGRKDVDRFESIAWETAVTGSPLFPDALAWIDCVIDAEHSAGDHTVVIGRVVALARQHEGGRPLLFFQGTYGRLEPLG